MSAIDGLCGALVSGVANKFSNDVGDGDVAVGVQFGDEFSELAAGDPGEPIEVGGAGVDDGFAVGAVVDGVGVDFDGDDPTVAEGGVVGVGGYDEVAHRPDGFIGGFPDLSEADS